jgi:hypothetical protein
MFRFCGWPKLRRRKHSTKTTGNHDVELANPREWSAESNGAGYAIRGVQSADYDHVELTIDHDTGAEDDGVDIVSLGKQGSDITPTKKPRYPDQPLATDQQQIRLLHLHPAQSEDEPICAELYVANLADTPDYEALSYTWGKCTLHQRVRTNADLDVVVTDNL